MWRHFVLVYASGLIWNRSYHNKGVRTGILLASLHCQLQEDKAAM